MLVLSNMMYENNTYIGSMAFDIETRRGKVYTASELSKEIVWGRELILAGNMLWMSKGTNPNEFFEVHPAASYYKKAMEEGRLGY